nr:hypothetical protein [Brucella intermedia]
MMEIIFSPQRSDDRLEIVKNGDVLILNGDELDFSDLPDGGEYPPEAIDNPFVIGGGSRMNGTIRLTVILPYSNPTPPEHVSFPAPVLLDYDGEIHLPDGCHLEQDDAAD